MEIDNLIRDPNYIRKYMKEMKDGSIVFTKEAKVYLPKRWEESDLINIADTVTTIAVLAISIDDRYCTTLTCSLMSTDPSKIGYVNINSEDYLELNYLPNDRFIINRSLVKRDNLPYKLFTFIFDKGRIPWYLNYVDISQVYDSSSKFANVNFNLPHTVFEMVTGVIARNKKEKSTYYRHGDWKIDPVYIPLRSVQFAASNTTAKLIGAYWDEGLSSALVNPSDRKELIEELLRS